MRRLILIIALAIPMEAISARVDTLLVYSACHDSSIQVLLIRPQALDSTSTVFLLHGYGGTFLSWSQNTGELDQLSDSLNISFVMPDAGNSWYLDLPSKGLCLTTFIGSELVQFMRDSFGIAGERSNTFIAGISMGGMGAVRIATTYPDNFGKIGALSGSFDLRMSKRGNEIIEQFGDGKSSFLDSASVIYYCDKLSPFHDSIFLDCGYQDYLFEATADMHRRLMDKGIGHILMNRSGKHDWSYWKESLPYLLVFFLQQDQ